jgi:hypothetical protein
MPTERPPYSRIALVVTLSTIVGLVVLDYWVSLG